MFQNRDRKKSCINVQGIVIISFKKCQSQKKKTFPQVVVFFFCLAMNVCRIIYLYYQTKFQTTSITYKIKTLLRLGFSELTPNRPLVHTSFTYPKLNMDGFSVLNGSLVYGDGSKKFKWNSLHAQQGIGKEEKTIIFSITFKFRNVLRFSPFARIAQSAEQPRPITEVKQH